MQPHTLYLILSSIKGQSVQLVLELVLNSLLGVLNLIFPCYRPAGGFSGARAPLYEYPAIIPTAPNQLS